MIAPPPATAAPHAPLWRSFWRWRGTLDARPYFVVGVTLFLLKMVMDSSVTTIVFGRTWNIFVYVAPFTDSLWPMSVDLADRRYYVTMALLSLPFIWVGTTLTVQRLRSAGIAPTLVLLFFVPPLNFLFFLILSFLPATAKHAEPAEELEPGREAWLESRSGAVVLGALTTLILAGTIVLSTNVLDTYGWGLFLGVPFVCGYVSASFHTLRRHRSARSCVNVGLLANLMLGMFLMLIAVEGIVCLLMAAPILLPVGMIGAHLAAMCQPRTEMIWTRVLSLLAILPLLAAAESQVPRVAPVAPVVTTVTVRAPIDRVWNHIVAFPPLAPPSELLFRMGVAYPTGAHIDGAGVGAIRRCVFSTGTFVEPITAWRAPEHLAFDVVAQPDALRELSPWPDLRPPHLDGGIVSHRGQFVLEALPDGTTRLEGTTWYQVSMWPNWYWRLWGDAIIHRIHGRVLDHVRSLAEAAG